MCGVTRCRPRCRAGVGAAATGRGGFERIDLQCVAAQHEPRWRRVTEPREISGERISHPVLCQTCLDVRPVHALALTGMRGWHDAAAASRAPEVTCHITRSAHVRSLLGPSWSCCSHAIAWRVMVRQGTRAAPR